MPSHPDLRRFPHLTSAVVESFISELAAVAIDVPDVPSIFVYTRDPNDAHYVDLAVVAKASIITSRDRDLLDLMSAASPESVEFRRRFPDLRILQPEALLREVEP